MRKDAKYLCIAVCGPLPNAVALMERRDDVEYTTFSNGSELYNCLEDDAPFDFIVIQSDAGEGMVPLYYPGCDGDCFVYLTADPQDADGWEILGHLKDTYERTKGENAVQVSKLALHTFQKDFHAFLRRETPPFPFALETA